MNVCTREYEFLLPARTVRLLVVSNTEELITDPSDEEAVPCWAELWPAARALAAYIWEHLDFAGATVLELGCGLGLPGVVCGLKGARVTFSDRRPEALALAVENARRNGVTAGTLLADWRAFRTDRSFDCIVGSDICYDPKLNPHLREVFRRHLKPGGRLLLAQPHRPAARALLEELSAAEFATVRRTTVPVLTEGELLPYHEIHVDELFRRS